VPVAGGGSGGGLWRVMPHGCRQYQINTTEARNKFKRMSHSVVLHAMAQHGMNPLATFQLPDRIANEIFYPTRHGPCCGGSVSRRQQLQGHRAAFGSSWR